MIFRKKWSNGGVAQDPTNSVKMHKGKRRKEKKSQNITNCMFYSFRKEPVIVQLPDV